MFNTSVIFNTIIYVQLDLIPHLNIVHYWDQIFLTDLNQYWILSQESIWLYSYKNTKLYKDKTPLPSR